MKYVLIVALAITSAALPARAEELSPLTRLEEKLRQHPEVSAYGDRAKSSSDYAKGELGLPDPMLTLQEQNYPIGSTMSRDQEQKALGFKQTIPSIGTRSARSERMTAEERRNQLAGEYAFATMKAKMIAALATRQRIMEQEKLLKRQLGLLGAEQSSLKGRVAANQANISMVSLNRADRTDIELMQADLEEEKHEVEAMLNNMLGEVPDVTLPPIVMGKWDDDLAKTYPVSIAGEETTMARKDIKLREAEFNPSFEVDANYGRMNGGDKAGTIMVGVSIPLWATESQKPKLSGAKAAAAAAESDRDVIRRDNYKSLHISKPR